MAEENEKVETSDKKRRRGSEDEEQQAERPRARLVPGHPQLRRPVRPLTSGPDSNDPAGRVHYGERVMPALRGALTVKLQPGAHE